MVTKNKLGILIAGVGGSIGSTVIASVELMVQKNRPRIGMICEQTHTGDNYSLVELLGTTKLEDLVISGWDIKEQTIGEALNLHAVLNREDINSISLGTLEKLPLPAPQQNNLSQQPSSDEFRNRISRIRQDIANFRHEHQLDTLVVVNCLPTLPTPTLSEIHNEVNLFKKACELGVR